MASDALGTLLHPMSVDAFLRNVWGRTSCTSRGKLGRFPALAAVDELSSIDRLLQHVADTGNVVTVRAWFQDTKGEHESIELSAQAARRLYRGGQVTIVVEGLERIVPAVRSLLTDMADSLGTPGDTACNVYASPPNVRTVMHFDPQETFFLQVRGKKHWRYAANRTLPYPLRASNYYEVVPAASGIGRTFPKRLPRGAKEITLTPGSMLYMTRGTWHEARSVSHSLALTLTFTSKTWCDVILDALRERLESSVAWRMPAAGITGDTNAKARAGPAFEDRMTALRDEVLAMGGFEPVDRGRRRASA